jgi:hypothetical protein
MNSIKTQHESSSGTTCGWLPHHATTRHRLAIVASALLIEPMPTRAPARASRRSAGPGLRPSRPACWRGVVHSDVFTAMKWPAIRQELRLTTPHAAPSGPDAIRVLGSADVGEQVDERWCGSGWLVNGMQGSGVHASSAPPLHLGFVVPDACPRPRQRVAGWRESARQEANASARI